MAEKKPVIGNTQQKDCPEERPLKEKFTHLQLGLHTSSSIKISNFQNINVATSLYI
jgi:hypothetical protein